MSPQVIDEPRKIALNPTQELFIRCKKPRFQAFFGGMGNGKTWAMNFKADAVCRSFPGANVLIARKDFRDLRATTMESFFELRPDLKSRYKSQEHIVEYPRAKGRPTPSRVTFRELKDLDGLAGGNFLAAGVDEADEVGEAAFFAIDRRLRQVVYDSTGKVVNPMLWLVGNPNGHDWIWQRFKHKHLEGQYDPGEYLLFEASTHENERNLAPNYLSKAKANLPEHLYRRYVEGSWEGFSGLIWPEFSQAKHVVQPFEIPEEWVKIRVIDHGYVNPTCCLWIAIDWDGVLYVYDEHYESSQSISYHAKVIKERDQRFMGTTYIDPSCMAKNREKDGKIVSVSDEYLEFGINCQPANNDVRGGINRVGEYFKSGRIKIFPNCINLIRELGDYQWKRLKDALLDEKNSPEEPRKVNDHACLAGEALVGTNAGPCRMDALHPGGLVWTRAGWREIIAHVKTRENAEVLRVTLSDGRSFRATPDHRLFLENGRKVFVDSLGYGDRLLAWSQLYSKGEPTSCIAVNATSDAERDIYTGMFGSQSVDQFRKGITSTTEAGIGSTMPLKTSTAFQAGTTFPSIPNSPARLPRHWLTSLVSGLSRVLGTVRRLAWRGIESMARFFGPDSKAPKSDARNAARHSWTDPASNAGSSAIPTARPGIFVVAVEPAGRADVYNITVDTDHEYFVEGVLSANCDALRYGVNANYFHLPAKGAEMFAEAEFAKVNRGDTGYGE